MVFVLVYNFYITRTAGISNNSTLASAQCVVSGDTQSILHPIYHVII